MLYYCIKVDIENKFSDGGTEEETTTFSHSTPFLLSQIILQCGLFYVDISREVHI